jgi:hypothetical protein
MKSTLKSVTYAFLFLFCLTQLTSCSKDSDLLAEYVLNEDLAALSNLVVDDSFAITNGQPTVLNVLQNDQFENLNNVTIVNTTAPQNGVITINEDQTLTYTPNVSTGENVPTTPEPTTPEPTTPEPTTPEPTTPEPTTPEPTTPEPTTPESEVVDTFEYVTEEVDATGEVSTSEGTVTVVLSPSGSKLPTTGANAYYVTTTGNGGNNGKTEATAWSLAHAFGTAKAGDVVHIKAGNYGASEFRINRSGASGNPIRFVGYSATPGDVVANQGSTFNYGDNVNQAQMPLLDANSSGEGIVIGGAHVELQNFQVKDYSLGIRVTGNNVTLNNVVVVDMGNQGVSNYDGFGVHFINTNNSLIQNSYIENATAESFKVNGGGNNRISYLEVRADNATSPTDYYILLSNTSNNIVEDSRVERAGGLAHGGHGLTCKWNSKNNIFRRCQTVYTNIEMNFEDVTGNLYEDIQMQGQGRGQWHTNINFRNGANNNTVRNITMNDVDYAFDFSDDNDGFTPSPDTDAPAVGYNNRIENVSVNNATMLMRALPLINIGGNINGIMRNNIFEGCTFSNYATLASLYARNEGNAFVNCSFTNGAGGVNAINQSPYRSDVTNNLKFTNCTFDNAPQ